MLIPLTPQERSDFLDKAAMMAMQGMLSNTQTDYSKSQLILGLSYDAAQSLIAERDRRTVKE